MVDGEPRWLDADERAAWLALNSVMVLLPAALDGQMQRDHGISLYEYLVLAMLSEAPERTLQLKALAQVTNGSLSRLSHVVTRLEGRGWVRRGPGAGGRRVTVAVLTDEGYAKVVAAAPSHVDAVRTSVFDGLDRDQVAALRTVSERILDQLDGQVPWPS